MNVLKQFVSGHSLIRAAQITLFKKLNRGKQCQ